MVAMNADSLSRSSSAPRAASAQAARFVAQRFRLSEAVADELPGVVAAVQVFSQVGEEGVELLLVLIAAGIVGGMAVAISREEPRRGAEQIHRMDAQAPVLAGL